jgi:hypothetical protein
MSSPSASHNNHDPFVILPQDIVLEILSYLTLEELCAVDNVSTHWRAAIWPRVWRAMCEREWVDGFEDKYRDAGKSFFL